MAKRVAPKHVALCLRVSTSEQTVENQRQELEAVAARHGWLIVKTFADEGISGTKGRQSRPGFDALCCGIARREFDVVAAWSVDRLGPPAGKESLGPTLLCLLYPPKSLSRGKSHRRRSSPLVALCQGHGCLAGYFSSRSVTFFSARARPRTSRRWLQSPFRQ
jgi:hypothetical protein